MTARATGRRPPKRAPAIRASRILTGVVPAHPSSADHFSRVSDWGLYGNDRYGVCGPTSLANQRKLTSLYLTGLEKSPTQDDVFDLYRRSGNPRFDPATGADDNGVDMQTMLEAALEGGIGGDKPLAFAAVDHTNLEEIRAAVAVFGSVLYGVNLETAQQDQTDAGVWDYRRSGEWGGHAVLGGRYSDLSDDAADRTGVVTWAELVDMTDSFMAHQLEEVWVVIWPEHLGSRAFLEGVDQQALARDYEALTGRPFPLEPAPTPVPPEPSPAPVGSADADLADAARSWLRLRHRGTNADMARALRTWLTAKHL